MLSAYDMLKQDEGLRYRAYKDTMGNITVGIGTNMDSPSARGLWLHADIPESFNTIYTQDGYLSTNSVIKLTNTAIDQCRIDLETTLCRDFTQYPDYVQLALINLMYNLGKSTFSQFTTFIGMIKGGNYEGAAKDLAATLWAKELPNRAKRVIALLNGNYSLYS